MWKTPWFLVLASVFGSTGCSYDLDSVRLGTGLIQVSTFAGTGGVGSADKDALTQAQFNEPGAILLDRQTQTVYVTNIDGSCVREIKNGQVRTLDCSRLAKNLRGLSFGNSEQNLLYVADSQNQRILQISLEDETVGILAGPSEHGTPGA
ncbi:MAG: hypothetical protein V1754_00535, partial [Pseudomonadota bacterium]